MYFNYIPVYKRLQTDNKRIQTFTIRIIFIGGRYFVSSKFNSCFTKNYNYERFKEQSTVNRKPWNGS